MRRLLPVVFVVLVLGTWPAAEGPREVPSTIDAGMAALAATPPSIRHVEVALAADMDLRQWHGHDLFRTAAVPPPSDDPIEALYEISVLVHADIDPQRFQDPLRGEIDVVQQLLDNLPRALNSTNDAVHSYQLLAMAVVAPEHPAIAELRIRLIALQGAAGAWGCGPWVGPECTSYALRALAATGGIPSDVRDRAVAYIETRRLGDSYTDPLNGADVQITAAAVRGLAAADAPVDPQVIAHLEASQVDGFWLKGGQPSAWATSEVLLALLAVR